jgi:4-amino-4-deoxy-L-arabinose transferase-like glycosyltransferase
LVWLALWTQFALGAVAARAAVALAATCPLWLAHGSLITTDATATMFFFAAAASAAALLDAKSLRARVFAAVALSVALALALATKYSMLAALVLIPFGFALDAWRLQRWTSLIWCLAAVAIGGGLGCSLAWGWPPDPAAYVEGVQLVGHNHLPETYWFWAFGELFRGHDALYFARALTVKVSLPSLLLLLAAVGFGLASWRQKRGPGEVARWRWLMIVPPLGYYVLMALRAPAIGVRYVLPVLPFLFMAAGFAAARLAERRLGRLWLIPLVLIQLLSFVVALRASPIAFFNGVFCFTGDVPPCLDDSNVDWGQALPALARFRAERYPNQALRIFYFGSSPPEAYVPGAISATPDEIVHPAAALYAVSLHLLVRAPRESWVRKLTPAAVVAGSYALYDLRRLQE